MVGDVHFIETLWLCVTLFWLVFLTIFGVCLLTVDHMLSPSSASKGWLARVYKKLCLPSCCPPFSVYLQFYVSIFNKIG